jgi:hypothetical protein
VESKLQYEQAQNKRLYFFSKTQGAPACLVLGVMAFWMGLLPDNDLVNIC